MKNFYVSITFDDGRLDNFTNALPILEKHNLRATFFITTGFIDESIDLNEVHSFSSCNNQHMTIEMCKKLLKKGHEIGSHSDKHTNNANDYLVSKMKIGKWFNLNNIGLSSPTSLIQEENFDLSTKLISNEFLYYRTSIRTCSLPFFQKIIFAANKYIHSPFIFAHFSNKFSTNLNKKSDLIYSIPIEKNTTISEIKRALKKAKENSLIVFLFHSISDEKNKWHFSPKKFESFCSVISKKPNLKVITLKELVLND